MKKTQILTTVAMAIMTLMTAVSCEQLNVNSVSSEPSEIVLTLNANKLVAETKAITAVSTLPSSLYWGATKGSDTEVMEWESSSAVISNGKLHTGKYQTLTPVAYNFYVSNAPLAVGANTTVTVTGGTDGIDVICGRVSASSDATPEVVLEHVFARTGSISIGAEKGTLSDVTYRIQPKIGGNTGTSGTYSLKTGTWSSVSGLSAGTTLTSSSDLYLIPGDYTISAEATYTLNNYSVTETRYGDITLTAGKINDIELSWPDVSDEIEVICSLQDWTTSSSRVNLQTYCDAVDLGYRVNGKAVLFAKWNIGATAEDQYGDYFAWAEKTSRHGNITWASNDAGWRDGNVLYSWSNTPYFGGIIGGYNPAQWYKYTGSDASRNMGDGADGLTELESEDDAAHVQWGGDWRMMNLDDVAFLQSCNAELVEVEATTWYEGDSFYAIKVYGKGEYSNNYILFPSAGYLESNNSEFEAYSFTGSQINYHAWYWTASLCDACSYAFACVWDGTNPLTRNTDGNYDFVREKGRYYGLPIRAVREVVL